MDCIEIKENLYDYATGRLDKKLRGEIESHVRSCPSCTQKLKEINETIALLDTAKPPQVTDYKKREVFNRLFKEPVDDVLGIKRQKITSETRCESPIKKEVEPEQKKPKQETSKAGTSATSSNLLWIIIIIALLLLIIYFL